MRLSRSQLKSLAEICRDIAQVSIAGLVIDPLVRESIDWRLTVAGLLLSLGLWYVNLFIVGRLEK